MCDAEIKRHRNGAIRRVHVKRRLDRGIFRLLFTIFDVGA